MYVQLYQTIFFIIIIIAYYDATHEGCVKIAVLALNYILRVLKNDDVKKNDCKHNFNQYSLGVCDVI